MSWSGLSFGVALLLAAAVAVAAPATAPQDRADSAAPAAAERGETYAAPLARAVDDLVVRRERREGYDREAFTHWVDADGDGCDTRDEVLLDEAVRRPRVGPGCALQGGRWRSWYDGGTWRDPADLDVDHLVPLAESWDSGPRRWGDRARERFANDLGEPRALVAVTDEVNAAKSDQDPAEWLPELRRCRYVRWWVAVKHRWRLSVDRAERSALGSLAEGCRDARVRVTVAR